MVCLERYGYADGSGSVVDFDPATGATIDAVQGRAQGFVQDLDGTILAAYAEDEKLIVWAERPLELTSDVSVHHKTGEIGDDCAVVFRRGEEEIARVTYRDPRRHIPLVDIAFGFEVELGADLGAFMAQAFSTPHGRARLIAKWDSSRQTNEAR